MSDVDQLSYRIWRNKVGRYETLEEGHEDDDLRGENTETDWKVRKCTENSLIAKENERNDLSG